MGVWGPQERNKYSREGNVASYGLQKLVCGLSGRSSEKNSPVKGARVLAEGSLGEGLLPRRVAARQTPRGRHTSVDKTFGRSCAGQSYCPRLYSTLRNHLRRQLLPGRKRGSFGLFQLGELDSVFPCRAALRAQAR